MLNLDRFSQGLPDPADKEPEVVCSCAGCGHPLRVGDEVVEDESGHRFCDTRCYFDWLEQQGVVKWTTLTPEA